jgi:hypothetical protein
MLKKKARLACIGSFIFFLAILSTIAILLAVSTIVFAEDGVTNPELFGYPVPVYEGDTNYPSPYDVGYPVPIYEGDTSYPAPEIIEPVSDTYQLEPVQVEPQSNYRNGRNLWQEIVFQFSKLLELMK